ncbi:sugar O-acetyltransferase [Alkalicoccus chagannorensis]|uniref:sugar O-acetyltransferase n=1 Tax=Alkalicoccus chagannorensis TaxID=427072 RepID=UPI0004031C1C|nr:sugar O-acetyltransferase [Alkalicoccus chagannorensis]
MTEREKMTAGLMYKPSDPELMEDRLRVRRKVREYNASSPAEAAGREDALRDILGSAGREVFMEPDVRFDYGYNMHVGDHFFANFDCTFLDVAEIRIGDNCMLGPGVHLYTASHPLGAEERNSGSEFAIPITIGDNVWIGGAAVINPGVMIGTGAVVASGAVVTKEVPPNTVVGGNPARVLKHLDS